MSLTETYISFCWRLGRSSRGFPAKKQSSTKHYLRPADNCRGKWSQQTVSKQGLCSSLFCALPFLLVLFVVSLGSLMPAISSEIFSWLDIASTCCHAADGSRQRNLMQLMSQISLCSTSEGMLFPLNFFDEQGKLAATVSDVNWIFQSTLINSLPGNAKDTETTRLRHDSLFSRPTAGGPPPCKPPREGKENSNRAKSLTLYRGLV